MKTILMVFMIVGLMSTVGVYAATFPGGQTVKTLGGTSSQTVDAPTTDSVDTSWTLDDGDVSAANVSWTPTATGTYDIHVTIEATTYSSLGVAGTAATAQTDAVTVSPAVAPDLVTTIEVAIVTQ